MDGSRAIQRRARILQGDAQNGHNSRLTCQVPLCMLSHTGHCDPKTARVAVLSFLRRPRTESTDAATACDLLIGETRRHLLHVSSSTGRAAASKAAGCGFDSYLASQFRPKPPANLTDAANIGDAVLKPGRGFSQSLQARALSLAER